MHPSEPHRTREGTQRLVNTPIRRNGHRRKSDDDCTIDRGGGEKGRGLEEEEDTLIKGEGSGVTPSSRSQTSSPSRLGLRCGVGGGVHDVGSSVLTQQVMETLFHDRVGSRN